MPNKRIEVIDGWRTIAALGVLYAHVWGTLKHPELNVAGFDLFKALNLFGNGVLLFYVISGFFFFRLSDESTVLTLKGSLAFVKRRWKRIAPAFYFAAAVLVVVNYPGMMSSMKMLIANFLFLHTLLPHAEIDSVFWSLAVEWHFYLLLPAILLASKKWGALPLIFFTLLIGIVLNALFYSGRLGDIPSWSYNLPANIGHFAWGFLLAWLVRTKKKLRLFYGAPGFFGGMLIAYTGKLLYFSSVVQAAGNFGFLLQAVGPFIMTFGFAMAIYGSLTSHVAGKIIGNSAFTFLGKISYSFYLWHNATMHFVFDHAPFSWDRSAGSLFLLLTITLVILIPISMLSYRVFESFYFSSSR